MHFLVRLKASGRKLVLVTGRELPALVRRADLVTTGARGQGTIELCDRMIAGDLAGVERRTKIGPAVTR